MSDYGSQNSFRKIIFLTSIFLCFLLLRIVSDFWFPNISFICSYTVPLAGEIEPQSPIPNSVVFLRTLPQPLSFCQIMVSFSEEFSFWWLVDVRDSTTSSLLLYPYTWNHDRTIRLHGSIQHKTVCTPSWSKTSHHSHWPYCTRFCYYSSTRFQSSSSNWARFELEVSGDASGLPLGSNDHGLLCLLNDIKTKMEECKENLKHIKNKKRIRWPEQLLRAVHMSLWAGTDGLNSLLKVKLSEISSKKRRRRTYFPSLTIDLLKFHLSFSQAS